MSSVPLLRNADMLLELRNLHGRRAFISAMRENPPCFCLFVDGAFGVSDKCAGNFFTGRFLQGVFWGIFLQKLQIFGGNFLFQNLVPSNFTYMA
jgi:hypothetical protein